MWERNRKYREKKRKKKMEKLKKEREEKKEQREKRLQNLRRNNEEREQQKIEEKRQKEREEEKRKKIEEEKQQKELRLLLKKQKEMELKTKQEEEIKKIIDLETKQIFENKLETTIKPRLKKEEIVVYKYIDFKEYFLALLKFILDYGHIIFFSLIIITFFILKYLYIDIYWYSSEYLDAKYGPTIIISIIVLIIFFILYVPFISDKNIFNWITKLKNILNYYKYSYVIFSKKWILFNREFLKYETHNLLNKLQKTSQTFKEILLNKNYILNEITKKTVYTWSFLDLLFFSIFLMLSNSLQDYNVSTILYVITAYILIKYISLKYNKTNNFNSTNFSTDDNWANYIIIIIIIIPIFALLIYFSSFVFFVFFILALLYIKKINIKAYYYIKYIVIFILLEYMYLSISRDINTLWFESFLKYFILSVLLENLFTTKYWRYIISIPVAIILFIPILIYNSIIWFKQKLLPSINEKIYYSLLNFWKNIDSIKSLHSQVIQWLDNFLDGKIFSVDKLIEKNFKMINNLIEENNKIIDKKLIPLVQGNNILAENVNIDNLKQNNKSKIKEVVNKMITILNKYIEKIEQKFRDMDDIKATDNPNIWHLELKENELKLLHSDLVKQRDILKNMNKVLTK